MNSISTSSSIISAITIIMKKVEEMKTICVDGVALSGMVMGEKFDKMHLNLKRKMSNRIEEIKPMKVNLSNVIE